MKFHFAAVKMSMAEFHKTAKRVVTGMMRLHSLKSVDEEGPPFEIYRSSLGDNTTLRMASRPEPMSHRAPRSLCIRTEISFPVFADMEAWRSPRNGQVDDACLIRDRLDCVGYAILAECYCTPVGMEGKLLRVEFGAIEGIRRPQVGRLAIWKEDLRIELACSVDTTDGASISVSPSGNGLEFLTRHCCR